MPTSQSQLPTEHHASSAKPPKSLCQLWKKTPLEIKQHIIAMIITPPHDPNIFDFEDPADVMETHMKNTVVLCDPSELLQPFEDAHAAVVDQIHRHLDAVDQAKQLLKQASDDKSAYTATHPPGQDAAEYDRLSTVNVKAIFHVALQEYRCRGYCVFFKHLEQAHNMLWHMHQARLGVLQ